MSEGSSSPKRPRLEFDDTAKDDHQDKYSKVRDQDYQVNDSNPRKRRADTDDDDLKDCDELKSKTTGIDAARREHTLVMRLTNKEQELQECMNQIQEMKQAQTQNTAQLRSMLLDPAINLVFQRMSKEMEEHKEKLKHKQNELNAWKFTPDSQTGMRLMGKCRMLLQENGELGKMISSGRAARLEGEISLHKALVAEMKKNQKELDEFVGELEEDVEGMQGMIFMLQQQLKEAKEQIVRLQEENEELRTLQLPTEPDPGGVFKNGLNADAKTGNLLTSSSKLVSSSCTTADPLQSKPLNRSILGSSDSAPVSGSADEFSPGSFSVKVTPDSGVQTQEEDDDASTCATDTHSLDEFSRSNLVNDYHNSHARIPDSHLEDGLRTSPNGSRDGEVLRTSNDKCFESTAKENIPKSGIHYRTSPTASVVTSSNGDVQIKRELVDSSVYGDGCDERTTQEEEEAMNDDSKDRTGGENDLKLTHNTSESVDDVSKCLNLKQEVEDSLEICSKLNVTNGSIEEDVTSSQGVE